MMRTSLKCVVQGGCSEEAIFKVVGEMMVRKIRMSGADCIGGVMIGLYGSEWIQ